MHVASPILRHRRLGLPTLAALLLAGGGLAQETGQGLGGTWQHTGGKSEIREVRAAIERCVGNMPGLLRPLARRRLMEGSGIPAHVVIRTSATRIAIEEAGGSALTSEPGRVTRAVSGTGDSVELLHELRDDTLIQRLINANGARYTTYRLLEGGSRLTLDVVTTSDYLPAPVVYRLTYHRASAAAPMEPGRHRARQELAR